MKNLFSFKRLSQALLPLFLFCSLIANAQCYQGNDSSDEQWGFDISEYAPKIADDFLVQPNHIYAIMEINLNIISDAWPYDLDLYFYDDDNGSPGELMIDHSIQGAEIADVDIIGTAYGMNIYRVNILVYNSFIPSFSGGPEGARYWFQPVMYTGGEPAYWEYTTTGSLGEPPHQINTNGEWFIPNSNVQAVFDMYCSDNYFHCFFEVEEEVLPITRMKFSNLDYSSDPESEIPFENFTSNRIYAVPGEEYEIVLEGNTGGDFTDYYSAFIGMYDEYDSFDFIAYEIDTITNSNGEDGQQATALITIPADLPEGRYRFIVSKDRDSFPLEPCTLVSYGQAEEYELIIKEESGDEGFCFIHYPENPWEEISYDLAEYTVAADFHIDEDEDMQVNSVTFLFHEYPEYIYSLSFYKDNNGSPGDIIMEPIVLEPSMIMPRQWLLESPIFLFYTTFELPEPLIFSGGLTGENYWVGISGETWGYLNESDEIYNGTRTYISGNGGISWEENIYDNDLFFVLEGECGELGINDFTASDFEFYPNPVNNILNFKTSKSIEKVEVYNSAGQKVSNKYFNKSENNLNMSHLSAGVYIIRVILNDGSVETFKIIKQ